MRHIGHVAYVDASTSGESFDGWSEPVEVYRWHDEGIDHWPRVKAWSWLLDKGWKRRGLISPFAVPGGAKLT